MFLWRGLPWRADCHTSYVTDFQAMAPNACPLTAPLRALAPCRGAEDQDHRPFECELSFSSVAVWKGQGGRFRHAELWSESTF